MKLELDSGHDSCLRKIRSVSALMVPCTHGLNAFRVVGIRRVVDARCWNPCSSAAERKSAALSITSPLMIDRPMIMQTTAKGRVTFRKRPKQWLICLWKIVWSGWIFPEVMWSCPYLGITDRYRILT